MVLLQARAVNMPVPLDIAKAAAWVFSVHLSDFCAPYV